MIKVTILIWLLLAFLTRSAAQSIPAKDEIRKQNAGTFSDGSNSSRNSKFDFGVDFGIGIPLGDFARNINYSTGWNINFFAYARLKRNLPFYIGLEWGHAVYGQVNRQIDSVFVPISKPYIDKISTTYSYDHWHAILRIKSNSNHRFVVFSEVSLGFRTFTTDSDFMKSLNNRYRTHVYGYSDTIFSYGFGFGASARIWLDCFFLHFQLRYLSGGEVRYLDPASGDQAITTRYYGGSTVNFIVDTTKFKQSTPDVLLVNMGISFMF
jgi:hypothetical protein